ncbi:GrpB family protein [Paenibacillus alvei]|uniref:GrpB family protein n=1 Tax=Paenibacillus alvei TaxID=44250 RepID=UPI0013DB3B0D|nr:GrpB family protein [Paenibacillus alvei]NEZ44072.1 hypothetical protein [Paenibacillus alvei]
MEIEIVPYHSSWKTEFLESGRRIRGALGDAAVRIYHIGSTSVEGLAAKPIIDIQISVRSWDDFEHMVHQFKSIGYIIEQIYHHSCCNRIIYLVSFDTVCR